MGEFKVGIGSEGERPGKHRGRGVVGGGGASKKAMGPKTFRAVYH